MLPVSSQQVQSRLAQAFEAHRSGDLSAAERAYRAVLALDPRQAQAMHLLGVLLFQLGEAAEGRRLVEAALKIAPRAADVWCNLGNMQKAAGERPGALASYRRAVQLKPGFGEAHYNLGVLLFDGGDTDEGEAALRRALAAGFEAPDLRRVLAERALAAERLDEAATHLRALARIDPNHGNREPSLRFAQSAIRRHAYDLASEILLAPVRAIHGVGGDPARAPDAFNHVTATKLRHDIAQLSRLRAMGLVAPAYDRAIDNLRTALEELPPPTGRDLVALTPRLRTLVGSVHNRLLHLDLGATVEGDALGAGVAPDKLQAAFAARPDLPHVVDEFLSPAAYEALRRHLLDSTIWWQTSFSGEIGTAIRNGFAPPVLMQVLQEVREKLPAIFGPHEPRIAWSYIYWSNASGLDMHVDDGAVSVNLWLTPDDANRKPGGSGLRFWNRAAPKAYFETADQAEKVRILEAIVGEGGAEETYVPYGCNRAAIFRSNMIHKTDATDFADGIENRRINVTMLFGTRRDA